MTPGRKPSKKRAAPSQIGPKPKKARTGKPPTKDEKPRVFKRDRPVTVPQAQDSDASFDGTAESLSEGEGEDEKMLDVPAKDSTTAKEAHKAQKILLDQRKASKPHAVLLRDAKRVWVLAHQKNMGSERQKHITDLMNIVRGHVKDIVFKHDASRIIQTIVRRGGPAERDDIATELKGSFKDLSESKYSKFLVTKLIRFCSSQRISILTELRGHVLRLLLHREASSVIADAFELYANSYERSLLVRDLYGKEAALFSSTTIGSEADKDKARKGLKGVLEHASPDQRTRILDATKENITKILNNPEKGAMTHAIVHRLLWEYQEALCELENEVEREVLWREMFQACQDVLAEMVHTKDGSRFVRELIVRGSAKDRKQVVKAIKPYVERMSQNEFAQLVLFSAFDIIDDTKLVAKSLVSELTAAAPVIWKSVCGRRSLIYLVAPRSRHHFTPEQISTLAGTDATRAQTSKKDDSVRATEIQRAASESLLEFVVNHGKEAAMDTGGSLLILEIMLQAEGDRAGAAETLLELIASPYPAPATSPPHPVDASHVARLYKTLLQGGHYERSSKSIAKPSSSFSPWAFASSFLTGVGRDVTVGMAQGNGAFVIAELCRRISAEGTSEEKELLRTWFTEGADKGVRGKEVKGRDVLLNSIDALFSA